MANGSNFIKVTTAPPTTTLSTEGCDMHEEIPKFERCWRTCAESRASLRPCTPVLNSYMKCFCELGWYWDKLSYPRSCIPFNLCSQYPWLYLIQVFQYRIKEQSRVRRAVVGAVCAVVATSGLRAAQVSLFAVAVRGTIIGAPNTVHLWIGKWAARLQVNFTTARIAVMTCNF